MSALTDPTNVLFYVLDDTPGSGLSEVDAYALLAGIPAASGELARQLLVASAEQARRTGGMIALVPTEADAGRLAVENGEEPGELHLTLAFLGDDVTTLDDETREKIIGVARRYAGTPVNAEVFAVNIFNPTKIDSDGSPGGCVVLGVGRADELPTLRSNIVSALGGLGGFELPEQHEPWVPHVTLRYTDDFSDVGGLTDRVGPVTFDRLRVALGTDVVDIPLEGGTVIHNNRDADGATAAVELTKERDVNAPGGGHNLRDYWVRGPGAAKIRWGTDGSFNRCVRNLSDKVRNPQGLCAEYHKAATGEWPAEKGVESAVEMAGGNGGAPAEGPECPKGHHKMPDGTCMSDADMYDYVLRARFGTSLETFHGNHNQDDHGNWADQLKGLNKITSAEFESTKKKLASPGTSTRSINPRSGDVEYERGIGARTSNGYDEDDDDDDDLGPTVAQNIKRMNQLEDKAEGDEGLDQDEAEELAELRRRYGQLNAAAKTRVRDEPWEGVLVVEGIESGDSRLFNLGSLDWAELPMPLQFQPANVGGHNESITVGNITHAARKKNQIYGWGTIFAEALTGEHGPMIRRMLDENGVGGVSVDVDKVKDADVELIYPEAAADGGGGIFAKPELTVFNRGRIRGATLVAFPAFVEAKLKFTEENIVTASAGDCDCVDDVLVAAAHTITIPNLPPAHWFNEPTDVQLSGALTITDEGRVFGIVAPAGVTHRDRPVQVPRNLDFARFHKGETIVEGGGRVVTGVITADCGHAATSNYGTLNSRIDHYDNSCSVLANVRVGYGRDGHIWAAGALNPGADPRQVAQALGCALSLDVQPHPDKLGVREFIAAHLVPVPGFPQARTSASVSLEDGVIVAASVPVVHANPPRVTVPYSAEVITLAKQALAARVGLDPASIKRNLSERIGI